MKKPFVITALFAVVVFSGCRESKPRQTRDEPPASPTTASRELKPIPQNAVEEGRKIFERVKSSYPQAVISIWGYSTPTVALWMPESDWNSLSSLERGNLGYYVKYQVPAIRANPGPHTGISSNAPIYSKLLSKCSRMSDDSWMIGIGPYDSKGELLLDHKAVTGSQTPWCANEDPK